MYKKYQTTMRILYGVQGEGMGHATRSKVVIEHLLKNHEVKVVSSSRAYKFLKKSFPGRVKKISGLNIEYQDASVERLKTAYKVLKVAPKNLYNNFKNYKSLMKGPKPDIVISDFESFSAFFGKYNKIPVISIDNMSVITRCKLDIKIPLKERNNYLIAKNIITASMPKCKKYFITSFFDASIKKKNTTIVPPIIRKRIQLAKSSNKGHILVYQTSKSQNNLVDILNQIPEEKFYVYGFDQDKDYGNVKMRPFSEDDFIKDLASAKAVVTNGGFTLISESVYLKKPVCSIPVKNQFEQYVNAAYIEKKGYGKFFESISLENIKDFIKGIPKYERKLAKYSQEGNKILFRNIDSEIEDLLNK